MIQKVKKFIDRHQLLVRGDKVVVALSGGADSCALLLSLMRLTPNYGISIVAAHFNHGVRGEESNEDEAFCRRLARECGVWFVSENCDQGLRKKGMSDEDFFRRERYRFLDSVAAAQGAQKIALGHHQNDQAETVLINMMRGSGLEGLRGFLPMRDGRYIRPLMNVQRQEIHEYLREAGQSFCQDSTNQSRIHLRNKVRLELIPYLKDHYNPAIEKTLAHMADILRREDEFIRSCVQDAMASMNIKQSSGRVQFSAAAFSDLPSALRFRLIKTLLEDWSADKNGFTLHHVQALVRLATESETGKMIHLPKGLSARRQYDQIWIEKGTTETLPPFEHPVNVPGRIEIPEIEGALMFRIGAKEDVDLSCGNQVFLDMDQIVFPLVARNRRHADWIQPMGMTGRRKIKRMFIDLKIPRRQRDEIILLADKESVVWVDGFCLDNRVKISPVTKRVLILEKQFEKAGDPSKGASTDQKRFELNEILL